MYKAVIAYLGRGNKDEAKVYNEQAEQLASNDEERLEVAMIYAQVDEAQKALDLSLIHI